MSEELPTLVIVIPTKNRRVLLERALDSVRVQSYKHYRIVIINDGSTDDTAEYLSRMIQSDITIITHTHSQGVNAARNAAYRSLQAGEWAVPLDDDDIFFPDAFSRMSEVIQSTPAHIQLLCFNTITSTPYGEYESGRLFEDGELWHEPTYLEFFVDTKMRGDTRAAYKWTLFPQYLFSEDVNGFEGEWYLRVIRDTIGIRMVSECISWIDQSHGQEQLSATAARRNPQSFVRVHRRIFADHHAFFSTHPEIARHRALGAMKLALRALDSSAFFSFASQYVRSFLGSVRRLPEQ